ncbi:glycerol dehydrogenase [Virgibacillus soli]|uniref:iron-containing alcohol dehydrogenase family protein n=1 Tax=Lederbergia galactosidilytica TaxID=217031 RepID=UPI0007158EFD|nr:iron-containing alcohol dehydrogenase family protein [Lederbergia galactosidilytica]KRG16509.1 glycerol dehydrogenase [Virgibacillus soli]MBP1914157.1 putative oxidoreductase [Lederbergia galactosidilytica]
MAELVVRGAPAEYVCRVGVLEELEEKLLLRNIQRVLIVTGVQSWIAAESLFPSFHTVESRRITYNGECTLEEMDRLANVAHAFQADAIIGVGGGKVLDVVKGACHQLGRKSILIPTLASNCAPWTPLSVIYTEDGQMTHYDIYPSSVDLLLVEPQILISAPVSMLIAGIGDTLAKWVEADVLICQLPHLSLPVKIAHDTAKLCADEMFAHGEAAIKASKEKQVHDSFIRIVETIIMLGGMVGGYGDQYGRIAGAHSIHNGLTVVPEAHSILHGDKVAYGILVQLTLEGKSDEVARYISFYERLGLPKSLQDMKIANKWIKKIAEQTTRTNESIHLMKDGGVTAEEVTSAILALESSI